MTELIKSLREHPFFELTEHSLKCPVCGGTLYTMSNIIFVVCDGNHILQCENDIEHRFWSHPFEKETILHLNKNASETNFKSEKDFVLENDIWIEKDEKCLPTNISYS